MPDHFPYLLPSGRVVYIHADVSKGAHYVTFQLGTGEVVLAADSEARRQLLLNVDASIEAAS